MDHPILHETTQLLRKDFPLAENLSAEALEDLVAAMTPIIQQMLNRDFERLLQICYRIDLGEQTLKKLLHETDPDQMAHEIATALVKRQVQKIEIRRRYSGN